MKDKVLIYYELTESSRYIGYRMVYYNKQLLSSDDTINYYDTDSNS